MNTITIWQHTEHTGYHLTPFGLFPSFSTIWSATSNQDALKAWKEANPGQSEIAADRGTRVHKVAEEYLLSGNVSKNRTLPKFDEDITGFVHSLLPELFRLQDIVWAEGSITDGKPDNKHRCIYHPELKYSGRPDIIAVDGTGSLCLIDIKTCLFNYYAQLPKQPVDYKTLLANKEISWGDIPREIRAGILKYKKVRCQLVAYALAAEFIGIKVDKVAALIALPEGVCQTFEFKRDSVEWGWGEKQWYSKLTKYQEFLEAEEKRQKKMSKTM